MNSSFMSANNRLACHLVDPSEPDEHPPGLILCHGFPIGPLDARQSAGTFPQLVDQIAHQLGYAAMTFTFRGCGDSAGDFSLQGWIDDLRTAIDVLYERTNPTALVLVGTNTGGSIAMCVAADDPRVAAAALLSPRADFDDWAAHPRRFLEHARDRCHPHARIPHVGRRVEQVVLPVPPGRGGAPLRAATDACHARHRGRQRARCRRPNDGAVTRQRRAADVVGCRSPAAP
ncbi:MAG: alpha/beta fold hydrolase [Ilumatobacteraceae bacterium]